MEDSRGHLQEYWQDSPERMDIHLTVHNEFTLRQFRIYGEFKFDIHKIPQDAPDGCVIAMESHENSGYQQQIYKAVSECSFFSDLGEGRRLYIQVNQAPVCDAAICSNPRDYKDPADCICKLIPMQDF